MSVIFILLVLVDWFLAATVVALLLGGVMRWRPVRDE